MADVVSGQDTFWGQLLTHSKADAINAKFAAVDTTLATTPSVYTAAEADPAAKPAKVGDIFIRLDTAKVWIATGTASADDWTALNPTV